MKKQRYGTIYVAVLGMSLLVTVIALGAVAAVRANARSRDRGNDVEDARFYALSGIELARLRITQDPNWRTDFTNGPWITSQSIGTGTVSVTGVNPNGTLANSELDPVNLTATGTKGIASQMIKVTLVSQPVALGCLGVAVDSASDALIKNATVRGTGAFSSGGAMNVQKTSLNGNALEGITVIVDNKSSGAGPASILATPRATPTAAVFNYYTQHGTVISYSSIPGGNIQNVVLSSTSNPYGAATDPNGVYVIDCGGGTITVQSCRLVGTLVLLNVGSSSKIGQSVNLAPMVANYPTLLIQGSVQLNVAASVLDEATAGNLNPPGTPYNGVSNSTATDTYPSVIKGLVYVSGNVIENNNTTLVGCLVIGGTLNVGQNFTINYDPTFANNPPPGFVVTPPPMVISPGTWSQGVN